MFFLSLVYHVIKFDVEDRDLVLPQYREFALPNTGFRVFLFFFMFNLPFHSMSCMSVILILTKRESRFYQIRVLGFFVFF